MNQPFGYHHSSAVVAQLKARFKPSISKFKKNQNINQDGRVKMSPGTNSSDINIMFDISERNLSRPSPPS